MKHLYDTPSNVANFLLAKGEEENVPLTQLKLMKLVYLAYGWVLATLDKKLFKENIEAWKHGPVVPSLYHEFKHFKYAPIISKSISFDMDDGTTDIPRINAEEKSSVIIEKVWNIYKRFPASVLVAKTHEEGTPWEKHYVPGVYGIPIPDEDIKSYFEKEILQLLEDA